MVAHDRYINKKQTEPKQTYGVLIQAWGPNDEPGKFRYREYVVQATNIEQAKDRAVKKAKNNYISGIIGAQDDYNIADIQPHE